MNVHFKQVVMCEHIWVFRTNIRYKKDIRKVGAILDELTIRSETGQPITKWNVAIDDADKVLRVESMLTAAEIISIINKAGYMCEELPD
jgi:copper chaperone